MLSENNQMKLTPYDKEQWSLLPQPITMRVKFCKRGNAQFFSHLDLQRTILRVLTRAGIPMWYTEGFNPHPKVVFALPLSIGVESVCEYIDLRIERDISPNEVMERLNRELTNDMRVLEVYRPTTSFSAIAYADYKADVRWNQFPLSKDDVLSFLKTSPVYITKKGKAGEKQVDIVPLIASVTIVKDEVVHMHMRLSATQESYLNPEAVLDVIRQKWQQGEEENPQNEWHTVMRREVYDAEGHIFR